MKRASSLGWLILGSPLALLIALSVYALVAQTPISAIEKELRNPETLTAIGISLRTTLIAMAIILAFGTCLALAIQKGGRTVSATLELLVTLPAMLPPSVAGIGLLLAFGRQGLLGPDLESHGITIGFTPIAVVMAQVFVSTPFYVREAATAFRSLDPQMLEAARLDGANGGRLAWSLILPVTLPFLITGAVMAWTRALGEFGATILFAGNMKGVTQTMPLAIYLGFESDLDQAKALAVILLLIAVGVLLLVRALLGRRMLFAH